MTMKFIRDFEPPLDDVLDDPVVQAMMTRDGVGRAEIVELASSVQERLVRRWPARAPAIAEAAVTEA